MTEYVNGQWLLSLRVCWVKVSVPFTPTPKEKNEVAIEAARSELSRRLLWKLRAVLVR